MYNIIRLSIQQSFRDLYRLEKRFAGHSKWQNIKHIKAEKDGEKSALFLQLAKRMQIAIAEGKSAKPSINGKLAGIIEEAKKKSMPIATINGVLERAEKSKFKEQSDVIDFRGPGHTLFIVRVLSDNLVGFRMSLNGILKRHGCLATEGKSFSAFDHTGYVLTEIKGDLDSATADAINIGAEEVEEIEDGKLYRFTCDPAIIPKITTQLKNLDYKVVTSDEEYIPHVTVSLKDADLKKVDAMYLKLRDLNEIVSIEHNIDFDEEEQQEKKPLR